MTNHLISQAIIFLLSGIASGAVLYLTVQAVLNWIFEDVPAFTYALVTYVGLGLFCLLNLETAIQLLSTSLIAGDMGVFELAAKGLLFIGFGSGVFLGVKTVDVVLNGKAAFG